MLNFITLKNLWPLLLLGLFLTKASAEDEEPFKENTTTAYFLWSLGNLVESRNPQYSLPVDQYIKNEWIYTLTAGILVRLQPSERLSLVSNLEVSTWNKYPRLPGKGDGEESQGLRYSAYIESAEATYIWGDLDAPPFTLNLGYIYFQYNTDAKTFGEYLFRTMIYPSLVFNGFDYPWSRITGLQLENQLLPNLKHNLILTTEAHRYPLFDFSIAYLIEYKLAEFLTFGAGANFKRIIPVRPSLTTPNQKDNVYYEIPAQADVEILDSVGLPIDTVSFPEAISGRLENTGRWEFLPTELVEPNTPEIYPGITGTKTTYSFAGTVLMGRFAVNPLGQKHTALGEEALKLYFEGAVLGLKNYPALYENRDERTVVMGGIRLPTFNLINTIALEVEYFPSKAVPSYWWRSHQNLPQPGAERPPPSFSDPEAIADEAKRLEKDDWKWSLYIRKNMRGYSLIAGAGTDHMRRADEDGFAFEEILTRPSQWFWQLRLRTHF